MGRKSALTPEQWVEIERRVLLDGDSVYKLAIEFGVNESSIRRKIKPNKTDKAEFGEKTAPELREIANRKVAADVESRQVESVIASLPYAKQQIVMTLAQRLTNISTHLASAAEYGAATAHRLSGIAHAKAEKIDDAAPLTGDSAEVLKGIAVLTRMANESSEIGLNLLKANKETIDDMNKQLNKQPEVTRIELVPMTNA
jgi:hypothetical protein